jgi:hypothetical protein
MDAYQCLEEGSANLSVTGQLINVLDFMFYGSCVLSHAQYLALPLQGESRHRGLDTNEQRLLMDMEIWV